MLKNEITEKEKESHRKKLDWFEANTQGNPGEAKTHALGFIRDDPTLFANLFFTDDKKKRFRVYPYQDLILNEKSKNVLVCIARQTGKSTTSAIKALHYAYFHDNALVVVVSATQKQSMELIQRMVAMLNSSRFSTWNDTLRAKDRESSQAIYLHSIGSTKSKKIVSRIISCPATNAARGYSADLVIVDEASFIENGDYIFNQVIEPMTAHTKGQIILLSTPKAMTGYYWDAYNHPEYWSVYQFDWRACPDFTEEEIERKRVTKTALEFATEYEAKFVANVNAYFPSELVKAAVQDGLAPSFVEPGRAVIGVDFGKIKDNSVIMVGVAEKNENEEDELRVVERIVIPLGTNYASVMAEIEALYKKYRPRKVILDASGVGEAPSEMLKLKGLPVEAIRFSWKNKGDILGNLRILFEQKRIKIPPAKDLITQLELMEYEYGEVNIKIAAPSGQHDDEVLALALMAWGLFRRGSSEAFFVEYPKTTHTIGNARNLVVRPKGELKHCDRCDNYYYANPEVDEPHGCLKSDSL